MRIAFLTSQFSRSSFQGSERYVAILAQALRDRDHDVWILAGDRTGRRPHPAFGAALDESEGLLAHPTAGWLAIVGVSPRRALRWLEHHRPDLVHVVNPAHVGIGLPLACRRMGIPVVVTVTDFWWLCPKSTLLRPGGAVCDGAPRSLECGRCIVISHWERRQGPQPTLRSPFSAVGAAVRSLSVSDLLRWPRRRALLLEQLDVTDHVIFPSPATEQAIRSRLMHDRCSVVPYGLPATWFLGNRHPVPEREPRALTIGFAGTLLPHKAPHLLLAAVRQLGGEAFRVRIAGGGPDEGYARALHDAARSLDVEFLGPVAPDRMRDFYRTVDVLAVTSVWPENCPFVILEAAAAGVPVIASRVPGITETISDERCLFRPGSAEELAARLETFRTDGHGIRPPRVRTSEWMTDVTEGIYHQAVEGRVEGRL